MAGDRLFSLPPGIRARVQRPVPNAFLETGGWVLFAVGTLTLLATAVLLMQLEPIDADLVRTAVVLRDPIREWAEDAIRYAPVLWVFLLLGSAYLAFLAARGFLGRYLFVRGAVADIVKARPAMVKEGTTRELLDLGLLSIEEARARDRSDNSLDSMRVIVTDRLLPTPFPMDQHLRLRMPVPEYFEALGNEVDNARARCRALAASLAGSFAANLLATIRLSQVLHG